VAGYDGQSGHYRLIIGLPPEPALEIVDMVAEGWDDVTGIDGAMDIALSPDGRNAYVTGVDSLAVFARDAGTGSLSFVEAHYDGLGDVDGLNGGYSVVVSQDGRHVYATGEWDDAVAAFAREMATGSLTFVEVLRDAALDSATGLAISLDGSHVYVASWGGTVSTYRGNSLPRRVRSTGAWRHAKPGWIHTHRVAGGGWHHRHIGGAVASCPGARPRGGAAGELREQPQAVWPGAVYVCQ